VKRGLGFEGIKGEERKRTGRGFLFLAEMALLEQRGD